MVASCTGGQGVAIWKSGPASQYGYACSSSATYGETGMVWPGAMGFLGAYSHCLSALLVWRWQNASVARTLLTFVRPGILY